MNMENTIELNLIEALEQHNLFEASLSNLRNKTKNEFGSGRQDRANKVQITDIQFIPSIADRSLLIKAKSYTSGKDDKYDTQIRFTNVTYRDEADPNTVEFKGVDGNTYNVVRLTHAQAMSKVRCTCLDFYYMFSVWNDQRKSLEGEPFPAYIKKTDSAPRNPNRIEGACKHVTKLGEYLKAKQIIR